MRTNNPQGVFLYFGKLRAILHKSLFFLWYYNRMDVYVEFVILDNAAVTYLIARLAYRVCALNCSRLRIIFACVAGTGISIVYPFIKTAWVGWSLRVFCYLLLCSILFIGKPKPFVSSLAFLMITFCFGGAIFAIGFAVTGDVENALSMKLSDIPIFAVTSGAVVAYSALKNCFAAVKRKRKVKRFCYDFSIGLFGEKYKFKGFVDTGNGLKHKGVPVVIINTKSLIKSLGAEATIKLAVYRKKLTIPIKTAVGYGKITLLPADEFILYIDRNTHILYDVAVGTSAHGIGGFDEYDALLPAEIFDAVERSEGEEDETEKIA